MRKLIKVKVFSASKKQGIVQKSKDRLEVQVKAKPLMGRANKETIVALATYFNIPETNIKLIKGHKQRNKIFEILPN